MYSRFQSYLEIPNLPQYVIPGDYNTQLVNQLSTAIVLAVQKSKTQTPFLSFIHYLYLYHSSFISTGEPKVMIYKMRILLLALSAAVVSVSAKNDKIKKVHRPGKLVGADNLVGGNTCYTTCTNANVCNQEECEVFELGEVSLGSFSCECSSCASGEVGHGGYNCNIGGIRSLTAEDDTTSASCGGDGFDVQLILGRDDCTVTGGLVDCPSTCECRHCDCNPCSEGETCVMKNENAGGFQCK